MEIKEIVTEIVLLGGWFFAIFQFFLSHRQNKIKPHRVF